MEWATMSEESRVDYLEKLMYALLSDRELVQKKLVQTPVRVSSEYHNGASSFNVYASQLEDTSNGAEQTCLENGDKERKRGFIKRFAGRVVVDDEQQVGTASKIRQVNKLNPAIVCKVQQIVTGTLDKEKAKNL
uniref:Uncharacterized protein n=1 Tax=Ditylenchus dipsaci TaxID=166011 RepID=A0A915DSS5_9BILA